MSRKRGLVRFALVTAAWFGLNCSSCDGGKGSLPTLELSASPNPLAIVLGANASFTTITVSGTEDGSPFVDGMSPVPKLTTDYGQFNSAPDPTQGGVGDQRIWDQYNISGHVGTVVLYPDSTPPADGAAHITATFADPYGNSVSATLTVTIQPAAPVEHLFFTCDSYNLGVLADTSTSIEIPCTASATDAQDQPVPGAKILYKAEAGTVAFDEANNELAYYPSLPGSVHSAPQDVAPGDLDTLVGNGGMSAEPSWMSDDGLVHNPRDGLVTLIAYVQADPAAVAAAPGMFAYQPFVDANDNQVYDATPTSPEVPEDFFDEYGDKKYHGENPQDTSGDQPAYLWAQVKVLWTGNIQTMPPVASVSPVTADIQYSQTQTFVFSILDQNFNTVASNDSTNDQVDWNLSPEPDLSLAGGQSATSPLVDPSDPRRIGMLLDTSFNFLAPGDSGSWMIGGFVSVTVADDYMCKTPLASESFTLYGAVEHTLFLDESGNPFNQADENTITVGGTLEPPPSATCSSG